MKNRLKAYIVTDNYFLDEYALVFAENASKAKSVAYSGDDLFWDNKYVDLRANRYTELDKFAEGEEAYYYRDYWYNYDIRRILMSHYSYYCNEFKPQECIYCKCNDVCEKWEEYLLEHKVDEELKIN